MYIWSLVWFWFKLEYIIDYNTKKRFVLSFIPSITLDRSYPDAGNFKASQLVFSFLIFVITIQYYHPANYFFNKEGDFLGYRIYPSANIEHYEYKLEQKDQE